MRDKTHWKYKHTTSFNIDDKMKEFMESHKEINWSETLRKKVREMMVELDTSEIHQSI